MLMLCREHFDSNGMYIGEDDAAEFCDVTIPSGLGRVQFESIKAEGVLFVGNKTQLYVSRDVTATHIELGDALLFAVGNITADDDIRSGGQITAGSQITAGGSIETAWAIVASGAITAEGHVVSDEAIIAGGSIEAGDHIKTDRYIQSRGHIRAGTFIHTGEGVESQLTIKCAAELLAGHRICAGMFRRKISSPEEQTITCGKLISGHVAYGRLIETGMPEPSSEDQDSLTGKTAVIDGRKYRLEPI